jgi:protein-S-isoprenylcysteine O-methyltransferase Ste14
VFGHNALSKFIQCLGLLIGFVSFLEMKKSVLKIYPEPDANSLLITTGIYKYIRHPMYLAILVFLFPLVTEYLNFNLGIYIILIYCLILKLNYEEALLSKKFNDYNNYKITTKKIIPFIY